MKSTFAGHPAAALLLAGTLAVWLVIEFRKGLNRRAEATNTDRGSLAFLRVCSGRRAVRRAGIESGRHGVFVRPGHLRYQPYRRLGGNRFALVVIPNSGALFHLYCDDQPEPTRHHKRPIPLPAPPKLCRAAADHRRDRFQLRELAEPCLPDLLSDDRLRLSHPRGGGGAVSDAR